MHPKSAPSYFLGKYSYKRLPMGIADSPDIFPWEDVGADGNLIVCKGLP
jgi:hypothetical protein